MLGGFIGVGLRQAKRGARKSAPDFAAKLQTSAVGAVLLAWTVRIYEFEYNFHAGVSSLEQFHSELYRCDATQWREEAAEFPARKAARIRGSPMNKSHRGETIFTYIVCRVRYRLCNWQ